MIKARHQWWAEALFDRYIIGLLRRSFHSLQWLGELPAINPHLPTVLIANHNSWWDGFFAYLVNKRVIGQNIFLMMLNEQLRRFPFFARIGAFGISPGQPGEALAALRYSVELLHLNSHPRTMLVLFPQGELLPFHSTDIHFKPGVEWIIKKFGQPLNLVPLAMRIEYRQHQHADVLFCADSATVVEAGCFAGLPWLEDELRHQLRTLEHHIREQTRGTILLRGRRSPGTDGVVRPEKQGGMP